MSNVAIEWLVLMILILEGPGSILGAESTVRMTVPVVLLPFGSLPIHY